MLAWGDTGGSILYLVSDEKKEFFPKLSNCGWLIIVLSEYHNLFFANDESLRVLFGLGYIILGFLGISSFFFFFFLISNKKFIKKSGKNYVQKGCYKKCIPPLHLKRTQVNKIYKILTREAAQTRNPLKQGFQKDISSFILLQVSQMKY